jgi:hypothetical protein
MAASPGGDVEAFWLARHFDSDDVHSGGADSFASLLHGDVAASSERLADAPQQPAAPSAPPLAPPGSSRSPSAAPLPAARVPSHSYAHASDQWRVRMARGNNGSQNDLLSWSATLGEPVQGIVISNELDPGHTLIRCARDRLWRRP